jgi:hypothetical protein
MKKIQNLDELNNLRARLSQEKPDQVIRVNICCGTGCRASGALEVVDALKERILKLKGTQRLYFLFVPYYYILIVCKTLLIEVLL